MIKILADLLGGRVGVCPQDNAQANSFEPCLVHFFNVFGPVSVFAQEGADSSGNRVYEGNHVAEENNGDIIQTAV